jgi:hypothetical protein
MDNVKYVDSSATKTVVCKKFSREACFLISRFRVFYRQKSILNKEFQKSWFIGKSF